MSNTRQSDKRIDRRRREELLEEIEKIRVAMGGYPDSNLVSLAESLRRNSDWLEQSPTHVADYLRGLHKAAEIASDFGFNVVGEEDSPDPVRKVIYSRQAQMIGACEASRRIYTLIFDILRSNELAQVVATKGAVYHIVFDQPSPVQSSDVPGAQK